MSFSSGSIIYTMKQQHRWHTYQLHNSKPVIYVVRNAFHQLQSTRLPRTLWTNASRHREDYPSCSLDRETCGKSWITIHKQVTDGFIALTVVISNRFHCFQLADAKYLSSPTLQLCSQKCWSLIRSRRLAEHSDVASMAL